MESLESCSVIPMCPVKTLQDMKDKIPTKHTVSGHSSQRKKQSNPFKFLVWIFLFMTVSSFVFHIPKVLYFSLIKKFLNYHLFPSKKSKHSCVIVSVLHKELNSIRYSTAPRKEVLGRGCGYCRQPLASSKRAP